MIKKMMALLAAISCAIGAWADVSGHLSGTDFSGLSAGSFVPGLDDLGQDSETTYWFVGDTADFEGTIVTNLSEEKFLDFESNITNPLYRTISGCYGKSSPSQFVTTPIGTGLFIDTTVQFTPYLVNENHPAPTAVTAEDKLIVWVRETEVEDGANITNLIVTAGYLDVNGDVTPSNYVANLSSAEVSDLCADEQRLTIKSFENITTHAGAYVMGFVVYLNRDPIEYAGNAFADGCVFFSDQAALIATPAKYYEQGGSNNRLFPSLIHYGASAQDDTLAEYSKLSGVGYAGMGKIGDVFFDTYSTDYPDFAADDLDFEVVVGDGVKSFDYLGATYTTNSIFTVPPTTASVTISNVKYSDGYKHKTGTWHNKAVVDNQVDENGNDYGTFLFANGTTLTLAGFMPNFIVNGEEFENLLGEDGALAAAKTGGCPLVLNNDIVIAITEGDGYLAVNGTLTIDLNGHTIQGTSKEFATIENLNSKLTIVDTSSTKLGKVLASPYGASLQLYDGVTTLNAGTYETIAPIEDAGLTLVLNGGTYLDPGHQTSEDPFYLVEYASGKTVDWNQVDELWYATVSSATPVTTYTVTFLTNNIEVAEYTTNIVAGATLPVEAIPAFTGGAWDVDPTNAVINAATNFNYTVKLPPAGSWELESQTDESASNKVVEVFGEAVAEKIHTYDTYTNMVSYLKGKGVADPDALKDGGAYVTQAPYVYQSYILGAEVLFAAEPKVTVTDVAANATAAGNWDFTVKVTEGESTAASIVAKDKVAALVKIRTSLTTGTWDAPTADKIKADTLDGGKLIKVTVDFGNGASGFMKVAE